MSGVTQRCRRDGDRGSVSLELAVLAPALLLFLAAVVAGGRIEIAAQAADSAARDAARQASISRDPQSARLTALDAARGILSAQGLHCTRLDVSVDTTGFGVPVGRAAQVRATVRCLLRLSDVAVTGLPGTWVVRATFVSPLDTYRQR